MTPTIEISLTRTFEAEHALPEVGVANRHSHAYTVECGYAQAIRADLGCARPLQDIEAELARVLARVEGRYLNDILPAPPTAEVLACWILGELPPHWQWVSIRAYGGFMCRVTRDQVAPWASTRRE